VSQGRVTRLLGRVVSVVVSSRRVGSKTRGRIPVVCAMLPYFLIAWLFRRLLFGVLSAVFVAALVLALVASPRPMCL